MIKGTGYDKVVLMGLLYVSYTYRVVYMAYNARRIPHQLEDKRYGGLQAQNKLDNLYDYEKQFVDIWQEFGKVALENNLVVLSKDKRKKTYDPRLRYNEQSPPVQ